MTNKELKEKIRIDIYKRTRLTKFTIINLTKLI
jgi:hypothetical protein